MTARPRGRDVLRALVSPRDIALWHVPGYTESREYGAGPSGRVVLARAAATGETAVIRYVPAALLLADVDRAEVFRHRVRRMAALDTPVVARLRFLAEDPRLALPRLYVGAAYGAALVTDAVDGVSLRRVLGEHGRLTTPAALHVLRRTLLGLTAGCLVDLVHGDLRPAKIVVGATGWTTLTGYGVPVLTRDDPAYRAPELWAGPDREASAAADVYAATCVFFACLTGEAPYPLPELFSVMSRHLCAPVPAAAVPGSVAALLRSGLAKDPRGRPSAPAFAAEVGRTAVAEFGPDWRVRGARELAWAATGRPRVSP